MATNRDKTTVRMSKMDQVEVSWEPEKGSLAYGDIIPVREPMMMTLLRVGGRIPVVDAQSFERVLYRHNRHTNVGK